VTVVAQEKATNGKRDRHWRVIIPFLSAREPRAKINFNLKSFSLRPFISPAAVVAVGAVGVHSQVTVLSTLPSHTHSPDTMKSFASLLIVVLLSGAPSVSSALAFSPRRSTLSMSTNVIAGATGYIGKNVVRESVRQGYNTIALVRDASKVTSSEGKALYGTFFDGATVVECDVTNLDQLEQVRVLYIYGCYAGTHKHSYSLYSLNKTFKDISEKEKIDAVVSCLASRSGIKKDAYAIDYQATSNCLKAAQATGVRHFCLLSAYCVKNPWLQFQQAKLKFEEELTSQSDVSYSIVRPTAFFKSVSGQLEVVQQGAPFVMFGDGEVTRCNPISEADLATYIIDCIKLPERKNKIINLGGPDEPLTMKKQGEVCYYSSSVVCSENV